MSLQRFRDRLRRHKAIFIGGPDGCAIIWDIKHASAVIAALAENNPDPDFEGYTCTEIDDPISPNPAFPALFFLIVLTIVGLVGGIGFIFSFFNGY